MDGVGLLGAVFGSLLVEWVAFFPSPSVTKFVKIVKKTESFK